MNDFDNFPLDLDEVEEECYVTEEEEEQDINECDFCPGCYIQ